MAEVREGWNALAACQVGLTAEDRMLIWAAIITFIIMTISFLISAWQVRAARRQEEWLTASVEGLRNERRKILKTRLGYATTDYQS